MLISRCAWHRRYFGYTKVLGITSWRGLDVEFTDGICHRCAAQVRADHLRVRFGRGVSADRRSTAWAPGLAALSLTVVIALVLIARPTHDPPAPPVVSLLPPTVVGPPAADVPAASVADPTPPPRAARLRPAEPPPAVIVEVPREGLLARTLASTGLSALPRMVMGLGSGSSARRVTPAWHANQSP